MIIEHRSKTSKDPDKNYVVAVCDRCREECPESKLPGETGDKAGVKADKIAQGIGWKEVFTQDKNPRRRKMVWTVELLCSECQVDIGRQPRCE